MENRPKERYLCWMRKEEPLQFIRNKLIARYRRGGLKKFEDNVQLMMGKMRIEQPGTVDPITKEQLKWIYVGEHWWCRRRKNKPHYEFARLMAAENSPKGRVLQLDGLWDARRHVTRQPPVEIREGERRGFVVGYNEFEILVEWLVDGQRKVVVPVREFGSLEFRYIEDHKKYMKIFSKIRKLRI